jgi:cobalt/nickel transport protein
MKGKRRLKMKGFTRFLISIVFVLFLATTAFAHFGVIMPSDDIIGEKDQKKINLKVYFMHPFEQEWLNMEKPKLFIVMLGDEKTDLLSTLVNKKVKGKNAWEAQFTIKRPGDYIFYLEPEPYWEPAEEKFIAHYPKVVVQALGKEEGWDKEAGLPIEIVPLTRPYGLWVGNVFQGIVKVNGKPLPYAEVEVEYFNEGGKVKAPKEPYITQVIKADSNGVFTYAIPKAGWWGFAALTEAPYKIKKDGKEYPVEIGGIIWVKAREMK